MYRFVECTISAITHLQDEPELWQPCHQHNKINDRYVSDNLVRFTNVKSPER